MPISLIKRGNSPVVAAFSVLLFAVLASSLDISSLGKILRIEHKAHAATVECSASVSPNTLDPGETQTITFVVTNNDMSDNILWIKIERPNSDYTIEDASPSQGNESHSSNSVTITDVEIYGPDSIEIEVTVETSDSESDEDDWDVKVADNSDGTDSTSCSGPLDTSISESNTENAPEISNVKVSNVTSSSAKITWATDEDSNSTVEYGTSSDYDKSKSSSKYIKKHSVTISSLKKNKTYHYRVKSADGDGNTSRSGDLTFTTAKEETISEIEEEEETDTTPEIVIDVAPPLVSIVTSFLKPFPQAPTITGKATDETKIEKVYFSTDGGVSFLSVDKFTPLSNTSATFEFTPVYLQDGDYKIVVKAEDSSKNVAFSTQNTLIIDKIPPQIGPLMVTQASQILQRDLSGLLTVINPKIKINVSAVGGPNKVDLKITEDSPSHSVFQQRTSLPPDSQPGSYGGSDGIKTTPLTKNPENGFWYGDLDLIHAGVFTLQSVSEDGAGNKTTQYLGKIQVIKRGVILSGNNPIGQAKISTFYLDPMENEFKLWQAEAFEQVNPTHTNHLGEYSVTLPPGKYYLKISADGYKEAKSEIFELKQTTSIIDKFNLDPETGGQDISSKLKDFLTKYTSRYISGANLKVYVSETGLKPQNQSQSVRTVGEFPNFLLKADGGDISLLNLKGKPTVITFLNSWHPQTSEQLAIFEKAQENHPQINFLAVFPHETDAFVKIYGKKGGYQTKLSADPYGVLSLGVSLRNIPTHYLLNKAGAIEQIIYGVLNEEELIDNLLE